MSQQKTDWELLELDSHTAGIEDVKKAFRKLAFANHPDFGGDPAKFIEIRKAYENLISEFDPTAIKDTDRLIEQILKELVQQYNQAFPWREVRPNMLVDGLDPYQNREVIKRDKRLRTYLTELARKQLASPKQLKASPVAIS